MAPFEAWDDEYHEIAQHIGPLSIRGALHLRLNSWSRTHWILWFIVIPICSLLRCVRMGLFFRAFHRHHRSMPTGFGKVCVLCKTERADAKKGSHRKRRQMGGKANTRTRFILLLFMSGRSFVLRRQILCQTVIRSLPRLFHVQSRTTVRVVRTVSIN